MKPAVGDVVAVVEKVNYGTDVRSVGVVARVLTRSAEHARGFKVMLATGVVGRCTEIRQRVAAETAPPNHLDPVVGSSEDYLAAIALPPPPGMRLRDVDSIEWIDGQQKNGADDGGLLDSLL